MKHFKKPSNRTAYRTPTPFPASGDESANDSAARPERNNASSNRSGEAKFKPFKVERSSMPAVVESSSDEVEFVETPNKALSVSHRSRPKDNVKETSKSNGGQSRAGIVYTKPSAGKIDNSDGASDIRLEPSPKIVDLARVVKERPKPTPIFKGRSQNIARASDDGHDADNCSDDADKDESSERTPRVSRNTVHDNDATPVARNNSRSASPIDIDVTPKAIRTCGEEKDSDAPIGVGSYGRQTRASNGITKKRVLIDAAILSSDDELPAHITPKKPRISTAKTTVRTNNISSANQEDNDSDDDFSGQNRKIEPLNLGVNDREPSEVQPDRAASAHSKGKTRASNVAFEHSPKSAYQREPVDDNEADDIFASDMATATRLSTASANEQRSRYRADHSAASASNVEESASEGRLHPDEIAAIDTAMRRTREEARRAGKAALDSDISKDSNSVGLVPTTPTVNYKLADGAGDNAGPTSSAPSSAQRRTFGQIVKTPGKTLMINAGAVLLDETMKFRVQALPNRCDVTRSHLQDSLLADDYTNLPKLRHVYVARNDKTPANYWSDRLGALRPWNAPPGSGSTMVSVWFSGWAVQCPNLDFDTACAAIRMQKYKNFVNPSRVSPLDLNILYTSNDNKRSILQANFKTAVCISPILTRDSYLLEPTNVGLRNKYLSGHFHHQEWERLEALACMVFDKKVMTAQIRDGALSFTTMGNIRGDREMSSPNRPPRNPSMLSAASSRAHSTKSKSNKPDTNVRSVLDLTDDIPVYDARGISFNFASDLEDLEDRLPKWIDEIPSHSFAVVGYTMGHYEKENRSNLTTNILFVILLATEGSDE